MNEIELHEIIDHQAKLSCLWLLNPTITEAALMAALRHLHAVIEGDSKVALQAKKIYWDMNI